MAKKTPRRAPQSAVGSDAASLVKVAGAQAEHGARAPLSKAQRSFNRLTDAIRQQREALALWDDYLPRVQQRVMAELIPAEQAVREAQRRLALRFDTLLASPAKADRLGKRQRAAVIRHLLALIEDLLGGGADEELEAIYDRHSAVSVAELRQEELSQVEAMLGAHLGDEVLRGHQAQTVEELLAHAHTKAEQMDAAQQARKAERRAKRRGGPTKAEQAAARKEQARLEAGRSVRDIFRKLASALHPDREPDPAERARKTLLMQRVNQAYERDDLLELLTLQIEIEQIDADHLAGLPEERLRHYNDVLKEQLTALEDQLEQRLAPLRMDFGLSPWGRVSPDEVEAALDEMTAEARHLHEQIEADLHALDDPNGRRTVLRELADLEQEAEMDLFDAFLMEMEGFDDPFAPARGKARRGKKRR